MKTQISSLIDGRKDVRIDQSNEKYTNAPKATSHLGYAGTNSKARHEIAERVIAENPDGLHIAAFGKEYFLNKKTSTTGKTVWFAAELSAEDFALFAGYMPEFKEGVEISYSINISMEMYVDVYCHTRNNERSQWRQRRNEYIGTEFITIL